MGGRVWRRAAVSAWVVERMKLMSLGLGLVAEMLVVRESSSLVRKKGFVEGLVSVGGICVSVVIKNGAIRVGFLVRFIRR